MTDLRALLKERAIERAVVIDDVFDDAPRPDELAAESWSTFFDDLEESDRTQLGQLYPRYEETDLEELVASETFIEVVWRNRGAFSTAARSALFSEYENTNVAERARLNELAEALIALGLNCTCMGRDLDVAASTAQLIFVDLFLGYKQTEGDFRCAISRVRELVEHRNDSPPLVVLMSRSPHLQERRNEFRDSAGLLGTFFRVISKMDLAKEGALENILFRLVTHLPDAQRVARFVHAWDKGLDSARKRFIGLLRRLDLPDLGQIQALVLEAEGEKLGDYLLDVADRVLQHEIERDSDTIAASLGLNSIDVTKYPAPHLRGSPDLQELVHRMIFVNPRRLALTETDGVPDILFGDVMRWVGDDGQTTPEVCLVITPACDLVRHSAKRVLLLSGTLEPLLPENWTYEPRPTRTPIVILPDDSRMWVSWDLKNVKSLSWEEFAAALANGGKLRRIGRLREQFALELQQKLVSDFGRIGQLARMPAYFPVVTSVFYVDEHGNAQRLIQDELESAVIVGRSAEGKPVHRLVLSEQACDEIRDAVLSRDSNSVHANGRNAFDCIKSDKTFFLKFERGEAESPVKSGAKPKLLKSDGNDNAYATIMRGDDLAAGDSTPNGMRRSALLVRVVDLEPSTADEAG
ncbi:MAG: hypothetical protein R3E87_21895 [Burkholderiaceae bacterium]